MPYLFPTLIAKGLSCSYKSSAPALVGVDLTVEPGTIHAIVGLSGAGKTTLAKILTGAIETSSGTIHIQGQLTSFRDLKDPVSKGIQVLRQVRASGGRLTVADALRLEGVPSHFGFVDTHEKNRRAAGILSNYGLPDTEPSDLMCSLSAGKQMLIEAAAILSKTSSLLILDDPGAALTNAESQALYDQIGRHRFAGSAIIWLTSRAEEALEVADIVSVLREGRMISTHDPDQVFVPQLRGEMIGRDDSHDPPIPPRVCGPETVLRVEGLNVEHSVYGLCIKVRRGEVLGLLGLSGAGQSETVNAIGGDLARQDGEIYLRASALPTRITTRDQALANGVGLISEPFGRSPFTTDHASPLLISRPVRGLNDSNPQKAAITQCLRANCSVLLFDNPTRGLNIACRFEMYRVLPDLASQGISIVVASTDSEELIRVSDRIAVLANGRILRIFDRAEFSADRMEKMLRG